MKEKIIDLKNKIVSEFTNLKNRIIPFIMENKKIAIIVLVALIIIILAICIIPSKKEYNINENLENLGFSVKKGNWVYYFGYKEGTADGIYRVKR